MSHLNIRLLNLFSKDTNVIDEVLVRVFSSFFRTMASVVGTAFEAWDHSWRPSYTL